jgi:uncharacterized membrane protein
MSNRLKSRWLNLSQSLGFVPGLIVTAFAALGIVLVQVDGRADLGGDEYLFGGDSSAARTLLSVVAGSLITVAGLTFSITMVVLQLASSQFSPRILRSFFADRITQVTIGAFVGIFVYSILVLRSIGSLGDPGFVPRLSVTAASLFSIAAVVLLVVFLNHVAKLAQVSHVTATIGRWTLARVDSLHPSPFAESDSTDGAAQLEKWREQPSGLVLPVDAIGVLVSAGDFVSAEQPVIEVWPAEAADECSDVLRNVVAIDSERDMDQDVGFGLRQLSDIAIKAMSPGINDPATAVTCVGYMRSILVRLAARGDGTDLRQLDGLTIVLRRTAFDELLEPLLQLSRYSGADAWVTGEVLRTLEATGTAAVSCGAHARVESLRAMADAVLEQARADLVTSQDRAVVDRLAAAVPSPPNAGTGNA